MAAVLRPGEFGGIDLRRLERARGGVVRTSTECRTVLVPPAGVAGISDCLRP